MFIEYPLNLSSRGGLVGWGVTFSFSRLWSRNRQTVDQILPWEWYSNRSLAERLCNYLNSRAPGANAFTIYCFMHYGYCWSFLYIYFVKLKRPNLQLNLKTIQWKLKILSSGQKVQILNSNVTKRVKNPLNTKHNILPASYSKWS